MSDTICINCKYLKRIEHENINHSGRCTWKKIHNCGTSYIVGSIYFRNCPHYEDGRRNLYKGNKNV